MRDPGGAGAVSGLEGGGRQKGWQTVPEGLAVGPSRDRVSGQARGVLTFNVLVVKFAVMFEHLI